MPLSHATAEFGDACADIGWASKFSAIDWREEHSGWIPLLPTVLAIAIDNNLHSFQRALPTCLQQPSQRRRKILHYCATAGRGIVGRGPARPAGNQAPKRKQHSDSSTLQRHPAAAPATKLLEVTTPVASLSGEQLTRMWISFPSPYSFYFRMIIYICIYIHIYIYICIHLYIHICIYITGSWVGIWQVDSWCSSQIPGGNPLISCCSQSLAESSQLLCSA